MTTPPSVMQSLHHIHPSPKRSHTRMPTPPETEDESHSLRGVRKVKSCVELEPPLPIPPFRSRSTSPRGWSVVGSSTGDWLSSADTKQTHRDSKICVDDAMSPASSMYDSDGECYKKPPTLSLAIGHVPVKTREAFDGIAGVGYQLETEFLKRYFVGEPIGRGATAIVVAGVRVKDGMDVAIKFIAKDKIPPTSWKRDRTLGIIPIEAFILKRVSHQNIIRFLDVHEDSNFFYLVMEAAHAIHPPTIQRGRTMTCDNGLPHRKPSSLSISSRKRGLQRRPSQDLFDVIERNPRMPERVVRHIFAQILDAIAHLHAMGYVHRDIKDENVIVDEEMCVKVIDFGAAAVVPRNRGEWFDEFCGTMVYCPTELASSRRSSRSSRSASVIPLSTGEDVDEDTIERMAKAPGGEKYRYRGPEQDIFSLGVLLYILLEGSRPYSSQSDRRERPAGLAVWIEEGSDEVRKKSGWGKRSEACRDLVWRMLEPDPEKRIDVQGILAHRWLATTFVE
ncbi:kinase-like domain-containing protein [Chytridium lagenaria]|nr:kinase-like domain-containing protein [Chytridium lagenaria]